METSNGETGDGPAGSVPPQLPGARGGAKGGGLVLVPREQLATMQKLCAAVHDAYFAFAETDGDAERVVRRLFDRTPEVLRAPVAPRTGEAPLAAAIARRRWKAAARLLALAEARNPRAVRQRSQPGGEDPLALAAATTGPDPDVLRRLVRLAKQFPRDARGRNALHAADDSALMVILGELRTLLGEGAGAPHLRDRLTEAVNAADSEGCTPVHRMAQGNRAAALLALLDLAQGCGLRPDWEAQQASGRGLTPLMLAAEAGALEACELLLGRGLAPADAQILAAGRLRELWLRAAPTRSARQLLARHCLGRSPGLLEPLADLPDADRGRLLEGLRAGPGAGRELVAQLRDRCPCAPAAWAEPDLWLAPGRFDTYCGLARLTVWDALLRLGRPDLARLLEGPATPPQ